MTGVTYDQTQSPFFNVLPAEIRQLIYSYVLSSYEDASRPFHRNTYWYRPGCTAPSKCDNLLLLSCRRVYDEAWRVCWSSMDPTFWLGNPERKPPDHRPTRTALTGSLQAITQHHGHEKLEISNVRFFTQMCELESCESLSEWLDLPGFFPRVVTIYVRHTDWWHWEQDQRLRIDSRWVTRCTFPLSVQVIKLELESLQRKRASVDSIAAQMKAGWFFTRKDSTRLFARTTPVATKTWQGSSTWSGSRWIRDETAPDTITYYVATVTFEQEEPDNNDDKIAVPKPIQSDVPYTPYPLGSVPADHQQQQQRQMELQQQQQVQLMQTQMELQRQQMQQQQQMMHQIVNVNVTPMPMPMPTRRGPRGRPYRVPGQPSWVP